MGNDDGGKYRSTNATIDEQSVANRILATFNAHAGYLIGVDPVAVAGAGAA
jgi:hypothetical protein